MQAKLSDNYIRTFEPSRPDRPIDVRDKQEHGLVLRVRPSGHKAFYAYVRRVASTPAAVCLTVVLALCLPFYWVSRLLMTDIPFACAMMGCCYALLRWQGDGQQRRWLTLAVVLAAVGVSLRSVGLILPMVLAVTVCFEGVVRRKVAGAMSRAALVAALASTPMLLFVARNATLADESVRHPPFGAVVQRATGGDTSARPIARFP